MIKVLAAWLLGLMLTVAGAITTIFLVNTNVYSPAHQVEAYFDALREGDGEHALGLFNATVPAANAAMLDGPALRQAAAGLENVRVGKPAPAADGQVTVPVTYTIGTAKHTTAFPLEKAGVEWLFFTKWEFVPSVLPVMELSIINQSEATLNGTRVAAPGGRNTFAVFYPGEFVAQYSSEFFAAPAKTLAVTERQPDSNRIALSTAATEKLVAAVDAQIRRFLDECAAQAVLQPTNCPFNYQTESRLAGDINWSITEYPEIVIEPYNGDWVMAPLAGTAELNTALQDLFSGAIEDVSVPRDFGFTARLTVSDSEIAVTPVVRY